MEKTSEACKSSLIIVTIASICGLLYLSILIQWSEHQRVLEARLNQIEKFQQNLFIDIRKLNQIKSFDSVRNVSNDINFDFTLLKKQLAKFQDKLLNEEKTLKNVNRNKRQLSEDDNEVSFSFQSQLISVCHSFSKLLKCSPSNASFNGTTSHIPLQHITTKERNHGSKGEKGEPGSNGQIGYNGLEGPRGKQGLKGDPGVCNCKVLSTSTKESSEKDVNNQKLQKEAFELVYTVWGSSTCPDTSKIIYSGQISMSKLAHSDGTLSGSNAVCLPISDRFFSKNFKTRTKKSISRENIAPGFNITIQKEKVTQLSSSQLSSSQLSSSQLSLKKALKEDILKKEAKQLKASIITGNFILKRTPLSTLNDNILNVSNACKNQNDTGNGYNHSNSNDNQSYKRYRRQLETNINDKKKVNSKSIDLIKDIKTSNKAASTMVTSKKLASSMTTPSKETPSIVKATIEAPSMVTSNKKTLKSNKFIETKATVGKMKTAVIPTITTTTIKVGSVKMTIEPVKLKVESTIKLLGQTKTLSDPTKIPGGQTITTFGLRRTTGNLNNAAPTNPSTVVKVTGSKITAAIQTKLVVNLTETNSLIKKISYPLQKMDSTKASLAQTTDDPIKTSSTKSTDQSTDILNKKSNDAIKTFDNTTSNGPTTNSPTTNNPTTNSPTTNSPTTNSPTTNNPTTNSPTTNSPTTNSPTTNSLRNRITDPIKDNVTKKSANQLKSTNSNNIVNKHDTNENDETNFAKLVGTRKYVPCALCQAHGKSAHIMIPSTTECPPEWNIEYFGYLMDYHHGTKQSQIMCVNDQALGISPESEFIAKKIISSYLSHIEIDCDTHPCSSNIYNEILKCVVCSK